MSGNEKKKNNIPEAWEGKAVAQKRTVVENVQPVEKNVAKILHDEALNETEKIRKINIKKREYIESEKSPKIDFNPSKHLLNKRKRLRVRL